MSPTNVQRYARLAGSTAPAAKTRPPVLKGITRERLTALRSRLADQRILLAVAPAGSGKTTFLAQLTASSDGPVAWYWAESSDALDGAFVRCLEQAFTAVIPTLPGGWGSAEDVGLALETWPGPPPMLVIDDFHVLRGSPAEAALEQVLAYCPDLRVLIASRSLPEFNLSRLRVSNALLEVGQDDLRFRSWEVEQLFRDFYGEPLPPEELALLSRRTEGWAAALQLFHLATRGKQAVHRRRTLATLSTRSKLMREYLARNVIDELPPRMREFMLETCVLGRLTGSLCDELLGTEGSELMLEELERRQLFTYVAGADEEYRYHEVLRSHLEATLVEEFGQAEAKARYRRAGALLEHTGALADALTALCRAEDWSAVTTLLGREGERLARGTPAWIDVLPSAVSRDDPWVLLAEARRLRREGWFTAAAEKYQQAETGFGAAARSEIARHERLELTAWIDPAATPSSDWSGLLRRATTREPLAIRQLAARQLPPPYRSLVPGVAALLAGHLAEAVRLLGDGIEEEDSSPGVLVGVRVAGAVAHLLSGAPCGVREAESAAEDAERLDLGWLARLGRAALVLAPWPDDRPAAGSVRRTFERYDDRWGAALTTLMEGWGALAARRDARAELGRAVEEFEQLRAEVLETWARAALALALARCGDRAARRAAIGAEFRARSLGVPGAHALALSALAASDPARSADCLARATELHQELSLPLPGGSAGSEEAAPSAAAPPSIEVRCFGGFDITIRGARVDLNGVRPRARQVLHLLALHAGRSVHREVLVEAIWSSTEPAAGNRSLHVAISSLRRVLEPDARRSGTSLIVREGEAYRLALTDDARVDLLEFDRQRADASMARARGDADKSIAAYRAALDLYRGELLPEDGPAEWLVRERDRLSAEACEAAGALAELLLERTDTAGAAAACERGLRIDRFRDDLWRLCISSHEQRGDVAAASRARRDYRSVLAELGVAPPPSIGRRPD